MTKVQYNPACSDAEEDRKVRLLGLVSPYLRFMVKEDPECRAWELNEEPEGWTASLLALCDQYDEDYKALQEWEVYCGEGWWEANDPSVGWWVDEGYCPSHGSWHFIIGTRTSGGSDPMAIEKLNCGHEVVAFSNKEEGFYIA